MNMKKLLTGILAFVTLCGCGVKSSSTNRLEEIKERGYITMATEPYFAPNEFIDPNKTGDEQYVGSDIEFGKYLAEKLGVELKVVPLEFTEVLSSVQQGKYDIAISALAYTEERAEAVNLTNSYYSSDDGKGYGMLVRKDDAGKYTSVESFKDATLIVQKGSLQEGLINKQIPEYAELKYLSSMNDTFMAISEGKADAAACAIDMAELFIEANPDLNLAIAEEFKFEIDLSKEGVVAAVMLGEDELLAAVNDIIEEFKTTGLFAQWTEEYKAYARTLGIMD